MDRQGRYESTMDFAAAMDRFRSSENPRNPGEILADINGEQHSGSAVEQDSRADYNGFISQERKQSVLSTISERDSEAEYLSEDVISKGPDEAKAEPTTVSDVSNQGSQHSAFLEGELAEREWLEGIIGHRTVIETIYLTPITPEEFIREYQANENSRSSGSRSEADEQDRGRAKKPSPLVIPDIFLQEQDGRTASYLPQRRVVNQENVDDEESFKTKARQRCSGLEWDVLDPTYDGDSNTSDDRETTTGWDDESVYGLMDCLYYMSTFTCCSIL